MTVTVDRGSTRRSEPRARRRAPALAAASRRLVEGRARDERDHRLRGLFLRHYLGMHDGARRRRPPLDPPPAAPTALGRRTSAGRATSPPRWRRTSPCGSPATRPTRRTCGVPPPSCARQAGSSGRACSRACGSRCSGSGRGTEVPAIPPEQILLPPRVPLSDLLLRLLGPPDDRRALGRLRAPPGDAVPFAIDELLTASGRRRAADRHVGARVHAARQGAPPLRAAARRPLRRRALRAAERWIVERQERDGSWGGIQPPWVWSIIALHALGYRLDHPVLERALAGLDSFTVEDERRPADRGVPVARVGHGAGALALLDAGVPPEHAGGLRAARWLPAGRSRSRGDWAVRRPDSRRRLGVRVRRTTTTPTSTTRPTSSSRCAARAAATRRSRPRVRGLAWALGMQSRTAAGARSTSTTRAACRPAAVLRLRRGHRPAVRRRHRAHGRDARLEGLADDPATRARHRVAAARAGAGRLVVRPLGRQLRLRHRRRRAGARRRGLAGAPERARRASPGSSACRTPTAAWARTCAPTASPTGAAAAPRPRRRPRGRCSPASPRASAAPAGRAGGAVARGVAAARRRLGRAVLHRAPASPATSTSITTCTGRCSR